MAFSAGTRFGPYEISALLGAGGMGQVYRARDTRLGRTIAIKVLHADQLPSPQARERFEREARAVSSLNHPHICTLHDIGAQDGLDYLVLEYIEGTPLKGPLAISKVIEYGMQIAAALDAAHGKGVIHRDLKPGNILITRTGVKILDFGLAQLEAQKPPSEDGATLTLVASLTTKGTILGTPAYMAPEQAEGKATDARTDIYALGVLLHELVTGKPVVHGKSVADMVASVLRDEPAPVPVRSLDRVLRKCLAKDPDERWQHAANIREALAGTAEDLAQNDTSHRGKTWPGWVAAGVLALACIALLFLRLPAESSTARPVRKFTITDTDISSPSISPDGRHILYINAKVQLADLVIYDLARGDRRIVASGPYVVRSAPFWSPDGKFVAYSVGGSYRKSPLTGGDSSLMLSVPSQYDFSSLLGTSFHPDGMSLMFAVGLPRRLYRAVLQAGSIEPVTLPQQSSKESSFTFPLELPGGKSVLFTAVPPSGTGAPELTWMDLASGRTEKLTEGSRPTLSTSGHVVFSRGRDLWAQAIQVDPWKAVGEPFLVAQNGRTPSVSNDETLVYVGDGGEGVEHLIFKDRRGQTMGEVGQSHTGMFMPRLAPDGKSALVFDAGVIWLHTLDGKKTRLTFNIEADRPAWHPSGAFFSFSSARDGNMDIYTQKLDGSSAPQRIAGTGGLDFGYDWSPDGKILVGTAITAKGASINYYRQSAGGNWESVPFVDTAFDSVSPMFSPDGKYIAYTSSESGRFEIYVKQFPEGGKWQVSTNGGVQPHWPADGKELFYVNGNTMMAVPVSLRPTFSSGKPQKLFEHPTLGRGRSQQYDVTRDGQKFLVVEVLKDPQKVIQVVENWYEEFRDHVLGR